MDKTLRPAIALLLLLAATIPATAQVTFTMGVGDDGGSSATVTMQRTRAGSGDYAAANVLSGVNVRSAPSTQSAILGTLSPGGTVMARCQYGWCELQDGGYVGQRFLSFDPGAALDDTPAATTDAALDQAPTTTLLAPPDEGQTMLQVAPPTGSDSVSANFGGSWTVTSDPTEPDVPLTLTQSGSSITGVLKGKRRVTTLTGEVQGTRLNFTYQMANAKGKQVATGNGYLTLSHQGKSLDGVLMLNGLVVANIDAKR